MNNFLLQETFCAYIDVVLGSQSLFVCYVLIWSKQQPVYLIIFYTFQKLVGRDLT